MMMPRVGKDLADSSLPRSEAAAALITRPDTFATDRLHKFHLFRDADELEGKMG